MKRERDLAVKLLVFSVMLIFGLGIYIFSTQRILGGIVMGVSAILALLIVEIVLPTGKSLFWSRRS